MVSAVPLVAEARALVSVCIPTFNNASMLGDAIRSAMAQTYQPLEIIVLDNHSTDDTQAIVGSIAGTDPRVRYVRHPVNLGMAGNFNAALMEARGRYVLILCADDYLEPGAVFCLADALAAEPGAVIAAGGRTIVDSAKLPIGFASGRGRREVVDGMALCTECFVHGNVVGEPSAVLLRADAAKRGFDAGYHQFVDIEMWTDMLRHGSAVLLPDAVAFIRRHEGQWSEANVRNGRLVSDKQAFFRNWSSELAADLPWRDKLMWDARMGSSVALTKASGASLSSSDVSEVFYPRLFRFEVALAGISKRVFNACRRAFAKWSLASRLRR